MRRLPSSSPSCSPSLVAAPAACRRPPARAKPLVGIGDQNFLMFQDKRFQRLHTQLTRLALPWDWYRNPSYLTFLDSWVSAARAAGGPPADRVHAQLAPERRHATACRTGCCARAS